MPAICFVSDSPYMLRMVEMRLHDLGVSVICFRDAAVALQAVDRGDADIVIIDDRWKDNTPYDLSRQVKTRGPNRALTLLLTENLTRREVQSAAQAGIDRILLRPQPLGVILRHVNEAFRNAGFGALKLPKDLAAGERGGCRGRRAVLDRVRAFDAVSAVPGIVYSRARCRTGVGPAQ
ncbi:MAG: hypothetical protein HYV63_10385 [Candidatus Schekmanbacteria bacterium]|nr:hypothetical protein [Candidatus Schekmanbacteria bacterium]